jgi:COP9 signalosome complex subunit 4
MTVQATSDMMHALGEAITCAILAPAGPQRSRLIGTLMKDERSSACTFFGILERMHNMRIVKNAQVKLFQEGLKPHQLATDREGTTVLAKAIIEHNMLSASQLYDNISLPELGMLLDVDKAMAEKYAAAMIEEGRMNGSIDQVDEVIQFADVSESATFSHWDTQVEALCISVNTVVESVSAKHPQFAAGL